MTGPSSMEAMDRAWEPTSLAAINSSENMGWQTPGWFLALVRQVGPIALDPATARNNPTGALAFYSQDPPLVTPGWLGPCGLRGEWPGNGLVFVNCPYGAHLSGPVEPDCEIKKKGVVVGIGRGWGARIAAHAKDDREVLSLLPVRTETDWWRTVYAASDLALFWSSPVHGSRIRFVHPETGEEGPQPNLASTVFYSGPRADLFREVFAPHGTLIVGGRS